MILGIINKIITKRNGSKGNILVAVLAVGLSSISAFCDQENTHDVFSISVGQDAAFGTSTSGGASFALDSESSISVASAYYADVLPATFLAKNVTSALGANPRATPFIVDLTYNRKFLDKALNARIGMLNASGSLFSAPFEGTPSLVDGVGPIFKLTYDQELFELGMECLYVIATAGSAKGISQNVLIYNVNAGYKITSRFSIGVMTDRARAFLSNLPSLTSSDIYSSYGGYFNIKMNNGMMMKVEAGNNGAAATNNSFYKGSITVPFIM